MSEAFEGTGFACMCRMNVYSYFDYPIWSSHPTNIVFVFGYVFYSILVNRQRKQSIWFF